MLSDLLHGPGLKVVECVLDQTQLTHGGRGQGGGGCVDACHGCNLLGSSEDCTLWELSYQIFLSMYTIFFTVSRSLGL